MRWVWARGAAYLVRDGDGRYVAEVCGDVAKAGAYHVKVVDGMAAKVGSADDVAPMLGRLMGRDDIPELSPPR